MAETIASFDFEEPQRKEERMSATGTSVKKRPKKVMNDPRGVVDEMLEGLVLANDGRIRKLPTVNALVRTKLHPNRVGLLIGGGSGHEPLFHGFIGENMADGAACGNVFAAPSPDIVLEATRAVNRGKGVLYLYGNYAGDNMNFDMGGELAAAEGIRVETIRIYDDVASAPPERASERRGIAGDLYMIKIVGAAVAAGLSLDEVLRVAKKARDNVRTIGVALWAGSIPETGEPTFILGDDEIEVGMGVHGEPGVKRQPMTTADDMTVQMMDRLLVDIPYKRGDKVVLLVNSLGATTCMECLIVNRKARQILASQGIAVHATDMGAFVTCQEMAGFSITLMKLDDELQRYYDLPADSFGYKKV